MPNISSNFLGILVRALESDWAVLSEEIGLWIPVQVANEEHDDKPEGIEEFGNIIFSSQNIFSHLLFPVSPYHPPPQGGTVETRKFIFILYFAGIS